MNDMIYRQAAMAYPHANGQFDHELVSADYEAACRNYRDWIEALPEASIWFDCRYVLPKNDRPVLITVRDDYYDKYHKLVEYKYVELGRYQDNHWIDSYGYPITAAPVVAWAYLPDPY